jgi:pimeloyl-ACP methyl ester carboxylesterase
LVGLLVLICATAAGQTTQPVEREVIFSGAGDVKLGASLMLPSQASAYRKVSGLVLVAGSGLTDRNGNQTGFAPDLLRQLAIGLANGGVASLRFDKRNVGLARKSIPTNPEKVVDYVAWDNFVADTKSALATLRQQVEVDSARTGMLGHSEGGMLILDAASSLRGREAPHVLVLIGTPGRTADLVIREQLDRYLRRINATPEGIKFMLDENARITDAIRRTGHVPADVPLGLRGLYPPEIGKFYQQQLKVEPAKLVSQFAGPVLVVYGEKDAQESPVLDASALDAALRTRKRDDHEILIVPSASHNLKPVNGDADPGIAGEVPAEAMRKIVAWIKSKSPIS